MVQEFTPNCAGRIVWGHPNQWRQKIDMDTKKPVFKEDGVTPVMESVVGLAFVKADFDREIRPYLEAEAKIGYPHAVPPRFAWKFDDGDTGVDGKNKPLRDKEGYAGHYILTISTQAFAPQVVKREADGKFRQMESKEIKCGDYVQPQLNVKVNVPTITSHTPGLYVNPVGYQFIGYGAEILKSSFDADTAFGGSSVAMPVGASTTPVVAAGGSTPSFSAPAFPPAGWVVHPSSAGYFYKGNEVLTEAELRAKFPPAPPVVTAPPAPVVPAAPPPPVATTLPPPHPTIVQGVPTAPPPPPVVAAPPPPPAPFPPAGWTAHPSSPGYFYQGQQVLSEAELRALPPGLPTGR